MQDQLEQLKYPIGKFVRPEATSPEQRKEQIAIIKALPSWMDACIENLDAAQLEVPYREGGWTIKQVVHHVADSHANAYIRVKLALTEDNPTIKPYKEAEWAKLPDVDAIPVNVSVTMLHAMHRRLVALLESMDDAAWQRTYFHPEQQRNVPLWEVVAMYAWHSKHHTAHIMQLRRRMNWPV